MTGETGEGGGGGGSSSSRLAERVSEARWENKKRIAWLSGAKIERRSVRRKVEESEGQEERVEKIDWWRRGEADVMETDGFAEKVEEEKLKLRTSTKSHISMPPLLTEEGTNLFTIALPFKKYSN